MPATHVALLRGINVGGNNMLAMTALAKRFTDAGCKDVVTYINSGNVVFRASAALARKLPAVIATAITKHHALEVPIVIRTAAQLAAIIDSNPFLAAKAPLKELYVGFLAKVPDAAAIAQLDQHYATLRVAARPGKAGPFPKRSPPDEFRVIDGEIYLRYCNGAGTTKLTNAYFDAKLATVSTVRNWNTVLKLHALVTGA
jgi:uncharacterized protein (DUF1697 family)